MAQFEKRFHGRHHVPGQLISAEELLEMQYLQYKTYCNVEADRYGLNPDGSFTPHVISGLTPSVVSGQHKIRIGRGQGFATASIFDHERVALVLENDLLVDLPAPNATHPYWCHVYLQAEPYTDPETYGSVPVGYKGTDDIIRTITTPIYFKMRTTVAHTLSGTAAASPVCEIMGSPHQLPIATVLINPGDTGAIPAGQLYDVRWFAPGVGEASVRFVGPSDDIIGPVASKGCFARVSAGTISAFGEYVLFGYVPNNAVFTLIPDYEFLPSVCFENFLEADWTQYSWFSEQPNYGTLKVPIHGYDLKTSIYSSGVGTPLPANFALTLSMRIEQSI